jgi:hypothetical protein
VRTTPIADLPDDVLLFLVSSRYCDSDKLADFAWSRFGNLSGGAGVVQAICDFGSRENPPQLRGCTLDPLRQRFYARRRRLLPRLRPSRHCALPLHEHSPRYCTGYLGDIGVPVDVNPTDFSAWFEVFLAGRWYTKDARHNHPRIGRIAMGRGRDAADVAMSTAFGLANLVRFEVATHPQAQVSSGVLSRRSRPRVERRGNQPRRPQARHQRDDALSKLLGAGRFRDGETRAACCSL